MGSFNVQGRPINIGLAHFNQQFRRAIPVALGMALLVAAGPAAHAQSQPLPAAAAKPVVTAADGLPVDSMTFDFNRDIAIQLVSFEEMYKLALAYAPSVKFEGAVSSAQLSAFQLSKLQVLQNVTGFANYSTGNQAILSTGTNVTDQLGQISNGYRAGVNVAISIHDVFGRPHQIRLARATYEATRERRRTAEIQLKRDLFNLYQDLILAQRVLQIRLRDDQASLAAFRIAEVELQKGKIAPETHAFNSNRYAETRTTVEQAKTSFIKSIYALELMVGVPIHQLKRQ
ncbi:TolC family protein [Spirosoma utsteinense]|uniref:Outer membrane protein TolC n=1 Tax=Spirosoma utsteinense TaxID=2585773 RepID=A0ABR6WD08_9BACT|nr:TolC family protein [Spirosoma utsteinense]MBC3788218.1 outer membrane protein TolC [Spirosoma utsteinense]MBC3794179.1 outer membrane protein TolC [Spirosoma utsteinense]